MIKVSMLFGAVTIEINKVFNVVMCSDVLYGFLLA